MLKFVFFVAFIISSFPMYGQDIKEHNLEDSLKLGIALHQHVLDSLTNRLKSHRDSIGGKDKSSWTKGVGILCGFDFNSFSNWANRGENLNSSASSINLSVNAFLNRKGEHSFWRNRTRIGLGWQRFKQSDEDKDAEYNKTADMLELVTHYGYHISKDIAMSMLSEWQSNLIDQELSPSYLDCSIGFTWTPINEFVGIIHPVNYELAIAEKDEGYRSSLGAKMVFEYTSKIQDKLSLESNFTGFLSYEALDMLSNFTWSNGVNLKIYKGLGLGVEYALRISKQETYAINTTDDYLQSYLVMGLAYDLN